MGAKYCRAVRQQVGERPAACRVHLHFGVKIASVLYFAKGSKNLDTRSALGIVYIHMHKTDMTEKRELVAGKMCEKCGEYAFMSLRQEESARSVVMR